MNLTQDQQKAVDTRGGKIVIGAAAGSGKTAVLSRRVINYILSGGSIKDLLIVTFTILAAKEMKERIKVNIQNALNNDKNNIHLQKELILIEDADIMTMDSFYSKLIKENFHLLNIKPDFKIISEVELSVLEKKVIANLIEELLLQNNESFKKLLDNFSNPKSGKTIEDLIIKFNKFIDDIPFSEKWLNELDNIYNVGNFNSSVWSEILYNDFKINLNDYKVLYKDVINESVLEDNLTLKLTPFFEEERTYIEKLIKFVEELKYDELIKYVESYSFSNFPIIRGYTDHSTVIKAKHVRSSFRNFIDSYKKKIDLYRPESFNFTIKAMSPIIHELAHTTLLYRKKLEEELFKQNYLTFKSIPQLLLKILIDDYNHLTGEYKRTSYAKQIEEMYEEILIDEYQDTNLIQDLIFKSISKDNTNLFIVGDVKQSIYGFRSARPELLNSEKSSASLDSFPMLINLSKNFRSRDYVINFTNYVFSKIMDLNFGNMEYNEGEKLNLGAIFEEYKDSVVEISILNSDEDAELEITNKERDALFVASKINELMSNNYQVYDNKIKGFRSIKYSDIAILLRNNENKDYVKALFDLGIPVYTESAPVYFDNYEVKLIIEMLEFIDNPYNEVALVSLLRSPIFMFSPNELLEIRLVDLKDNLYNNLKKLNKEKINNFLEKTQKWRELGAKLAVDKLLVSVYNDSDLITILSIGRESEQITKNILEMIVYAEEFVKSGKYLLNEFLNYLKELIDNKVKLEGVNPPPDKDSVLITTIHKSKGLEFPVVFLPNLDKRFNVGDLKDELITDIDYYLSFKLRNYENYTADSNIILELMKKRINQKALEEEMRVLYVALTRAKEKLILSGTVNKLSDKINKVTSLIGNERKILPSYLLNANSYMDWILPLVIKHGSENVLQNYTDIYIKKFNDVVEFKVDIISNNNFNGDRKFYSISLSDIDFEDVKNVLTFTLPNASKYKESMSVTEINSSNYFKEPMFVKGTQGTTVGTIYHKIIEKLPIKKYNVEDLKEEVNNLISKNIITTEEKKKVDINKIYTYLNSDIYNNVILNGTSYKEHEISFLIPANLVDDEVNEGEILVEGIIDLFCLVDDSVYIIDFKSDLATESELIEKYKKQLDLYEYYFKNKYKNFYKYIYSLHLGKFISI